MELSSALREPMIVTTWTRKNVVLSILCVLFCAAAVYSFLAANMGDGRKRRPDTIETTTTWVCGECSHDVAYTARELNDARVAGSKLSRETRQDGGYTSRRTITLICPTCEAFALSRGGYCQTCDESFIASPKTIGVHCERCSRKLDMTEKKKKKRKPGLRRP